LRFVEGYDHEAFLHDDKTFYAATRCLEIISEASRQLSPSFKARFPEIPWKAAAGAGSIYRHGYEHVQERRVWATLHGDLPARYAVAETALYGP